MNNCSSHYRSLGLLGTFNNDAHDDLTSPDCNSVTVRYPSNDAESRTIYYSFGDKWRVDGSVHPLLFQTERLPINDPISFANPHFEPIFDPWRITNQTFWESLVFTRDQVRVACQSVPSCEFDYILTGRREIALDTLDAEKKFEGLKAKGETDLVSCGPLVKNRGVIKHPPGNNYLDGVTVTFNCKPEYFLHGTQQRTCVNGTWSPGWWVWCRDRTEETALKWVTGVITSLLIIALIVGIFLWCYFMRIKGRKNTARYYHTREPLQAKDQQKKTTTVQKLSPEEDPPEPVFTVPVLQTEPPKVGLHTSGQHRYAETSA